MKSMIHKLQDNKGSSMILALFLMLVSLMVSNTILAAAASASRSFLTQTDRQQSYLTVSSAAQVFQNSVASGNCNYSRTIVSVTGAADKEEKQAMSGPFSQEIGDAVEALLGAYAATGYERDYLITVGSSAEEFEPMNLHLRLEKTDIDEDTDRVQDCLLTATFSNVLPQSTAAMVSGYTPPYAPTQMVLTLRGSLSHTEREYNTVDGNRAKKAEDVLQWRANTMELSKPVVGEEDLP